MGANASTHGGPATTAPIPVYPPSMGPPQPQGGPYGPGPVSAGPPYRSRPPPDMGYGPPGGYGPPQARMGPPPRRIGPPPPPAGFGNGPPPVRLGDRNYGPPGGPLGGPSDQNSGLQPRGNYPPDLRRILDDDDDIFDDEDIFMKPPPRPNYSDPSSVERYALAKLNKHGLNIQPDQANRVYSRPPGNRGPSGPVQPSREPQYRAKPQFYHFQPQGDEQYTLRYDPATGRLDDSIPGLSEIGGYRVESYNLPPAFDNGGSGPIPGGFPSMGGFSQSGPPPASIQVPGMPPIISGGYSGGAPPQVFAGPYGGGQGPIVVPGNW